MPPSRLYASTLVRNLPSQQGWPSSRHTLIGHMTCLEGRNHPVRPGHQPLSALVRRQNASASTILMTARLLFERLQCQFPIANAIVARKLPDRFGRIKARAIVALVRICLRFTIYLSRRGATASGTPTPAGHGEMVDRGTETAQAALTSPLGAARLERAPAGDWAFLSSITAISCEPFLPRITSTYAEPRRFNSSVLITVEALKDQKLSPNPLTITSF